MSTNTNISISISIPTSRPPQDCGWVTEPEPPICAKVRAWFTPGRYQRYGGPWGDRRAFIEGPGDIVWKVASLGPDGYRHVLHGERGGVFLWPESAIETLISSNVMAITFVFYAYPSYGESPVFKIVTMIWVRADTCGVPLDDAICLGAGPASRQIVL